MLHAGRCAMGDTDMSVVDSELRVHRNGLCHRRARGRDDRRRQCPRKWWISDRRDSRVMINESC
jgi:hypothetical protein